MKRKKVIKISTLLAMAVLFGAVLVLAGCENPTGPEETKPEVPEGVKAEAEDFLRTLEDMWGTVSAEGGTVTLSGTIRVVKAGETLVVPPGVRFVIESGGGLEIKSGAVLKIEPTAAVIVAPDARALFEGTVDVYGALNIEKGAAVEASAGVITIKAGAASVNGNPDWEAAGTWVFEGGCTADVVDAEGEYLAFIGNWESILTLPEGASLTVAVQGDGVRAYNLVGAKGASPVLNREWTLGEDAALTVSGAFTVNAGLSGGSISYVKATVITGLKIGDFLETARQAAITFTVSFDSQGGSAAAGQSVVSGGNAAAPSPAPTKDGYTLEGWYTEAEYTTRWDFTNNTVTGNTTLYAKWTQVAAGGTVTVTDITGVPSTVTKNFEADLNGATVIPATATNKTIVWSVKDAGGTGVTSAGIVNGKFEAEQTGTLVLTATIANGNGEGTPFTKDFTITVKAPGAGTGTVSLGDDTTIKLYANGGTAALSTSEVIPVPKTAPYYVNIDSGYNNIVWYLNNTKSTISGAKIYLDTSKAGATVKVTVEAVKDGKADTGIYTFKIGN
jgi:uncharacterized repeat protein (TIGR02543 family)